jgi:large subunit ribosomal protein L6
MSRIGKMPIALPAGVKAGVEPNRVEIQGPKGTLATAIPPGISCALEGGQLVVTRRDDSKQAKSFHGLTRALLANAVKGVHEGYKKELDIVGVGYKAVLEGKNVVLNLGLSHPVEFPIPAGIQITVEKNTHLVITGHDKQLVGQVAAQIRSFRKCEPYKGKGVMYTGEVIKRKAGKAAK